MSKKYFLIAVIFACLTFAIGGSAWLYKYFQNSQLTDGEPTFARTKAKIVHLGKVRISSPDGAEITLYRHNGLWRFKEAKNYFVNLGQLNGLFNMINDSAIIQVDEASENKLKKYDLSEQSGFLLQTYNIDGKLLDSLIIGRKNKDNTCYARMQKSDKYIYRITSCAAFSADVADWMPYPLLSLSYQNFERIKTAENEFKYEEIDKQIIKSVDIRRLILSLGTLDYQGIVFRDEILNNVDLTINTRQFEIELINGLIYIFKIHKIDDNYWLELDMKPGVVTDKTVRPFIESNQQYFDEWLFQLNNYQGEILFNYSE